MASTNSTPTTFGATIIPSARSTREERFAPPAAMLDSPALTPIASREGASDEDNAHAVPAYSPFYDHSRQPLSQVPSHVSLQKEDGAVIEKEMGLRGNRPLIAPDPEDPFSSRISVNHTNGQEDGMWPSKQTLMQGRLAEKKRRRDRRGCRGCGPVVEFWQRRSKRERLGIKLGIAVVVVGLAITIGLCISIAVHGSFNSSPNSQHQIQTR